MTSLRSMCELEVERQAILQKLSDKNLAPNAVLELAERLSEILFKIHEGKKEYTQEHSCDLE